MKMDKMKKQNAVQRLRKFTGLSQPQFAKLVGVSAPAIASIETGRLKVSEELAERISIATGVFPFSIMSEHDSTPIYLGDMKPYSTESYKEWKQDTATSVNGQDTAEEVDIQMTEKACVQLAVLQEAARRKNRLFAVQYRLQRWFDEILSDYNLQSECEKIYGERIKAKNMDPLYARPLFEKPFGFGGGFVKLGTKSLKKMYLHRRKSGQKAGQ